jgi:uncharacterized membrane protein HdeD (DUF308 family)
MLFTLLGGICGIAALICGVIILIAAFKDEIWKGVVGLLCGLYLLYYGIVEFNHPNKWLIVGIAFLGGAIGSFLIRMGGAMAGYHG